MPSLPARIESREELVAISFWLVTSIGASVFQLLSMLGLSSYCISGYLEVSILFMWVFFCGKVRIPRSVCYCDVIIGPRTYFWNA